MKSRQISSINVIQIGEEITPEDIEKIPHIKEYVVNELIYSIKDAIKLNKDIAVLFEVNNSGYVVELEKNGWITALEKVMPYYEKQENFEKCALIRDLIKSTHESRNKQDNSSNEQYSRRKNASKKEEDSKETINIPKQEDI